MLWRMTKLLLALLVFLTPALARAKYESCSVTNGQPTGCSGWYQGWGIVQVDGSYRACRIVNGDVRGCGQAFTGPAPLRVYGEIRTCKIVNGQVTTCGGWFTGKTAVWR